MSFRDDLLGVLSGGLPALIDDPSGATAGGGTTTPVAGPVQVQPARVEETAPIGTNVDREPFLMGVSQSQILIGTAAVMGLIALVMIAKR